MTIFRYSTILCVLGSLVSLHAMEENSLKEDSPTSHTSTNGHAQLRRKLSQKKLHFKKEDESQQQLFSKLQEELKKATPDFNNLKSYLGLTAGKQYKDGNTPLLHILSEIQKEKDTDIRSTKIRAVLILLRSHQFEIDWEYHNKKGKTVKTIIKLKRNDPGLDALQKQINALSPDTEDNQQLIEACDETGAYRCMPRKDAIELACKRTQSALQEQTLNGQRNRMAVIRMHVKDKKKSIRKAAIKRLEELQSEQHDPFLEEELKRMSNLEAHFLKTSVDTIKTRGSFETCKILHQHVEELQKNPNLTEQEKKEAQEWQDFFQEKLSSKNS